MYKTLMVGIIILGGCAGGVTHNGATQAGATNKTDRPRPTRIPLVPERNIIREEITSFYRWLLKNNLLVLRIENINYPKEREVDSITHLPIPKPELSQEEMKSKLLELLEKGIEDGPSDISRICPPGNWESD